MIRINDKYAVEKDSRWGWILHTYHITKPSPFGAGGAVKDVETYHPNLKACAKEVADDMAGEEAGDLKDMVAALTRLEQAILEKMK